MSTSSTPDSQSRKLSPWAWVGIGVSVLMTVWFVGDIQWKQIRMELLSVQLWPVCVAAALLLSEFWLRALRWKVVLTPVAPNARIRDLFSASVVGAAGNTLLPMRAGEIARALVASRHTGLGITTVLATNVMERVYDLFGLVTVLVVMVLLLPDTLGGSAGEQQLVENLQVYGGILGISALIAMMIFFALARRPQRAKRFASYFLGILPEVIARPAVGVVDAFLAGFSSAGEIRLMRRSLLFSVVLWFNGSFAIYFLFRAFSLDLPYSAACFTTVAIALTVLLPQAPGFFGVFHVAIEKTLVLWQVPEVSAEAFAIVFWAVSFVPVTALGLAATWREGLSLAALKRHARRATNG